MARGRCTTNSPLDSARTVDVLVCPASSSNALNVNGDRNKIPSANASAHDRPWRATPRPGGGGDVGPSPERRYAVR
jgi:hypothetical protein